MIQINFLKSKSGPSDRGSPAPDFGGFEEGDELNVDSREGPLKLGVILALPLLLFLYGRWNVASLESTYRALNIHLRQLQTQVQAKSNVTAVMHQLQLEKQTLEAQIKEIRQLNSKRIRDVQALDTIQSTLPDGVWMGKLSIIGNAMKITGYAVNGIGISSLVNGLEQSVFFRDVLLTSSTDQKMASGSFKKFGITCKVSEAQ